MKSQSNYSVHFERDQNYSNLNDQRDLNETGESSFNNKSIQMNLSFQESSLNFNNDVIINTNTIQKLS